MGWMLVVLVFLVFLGLGRPTVVVVPAPEVHLEINQEGSTGVWPPWDPLAISGDNRYEFRGDKEEPTEG